MDKRFHLKLEVQSEQNVVDVLRANCDLSKSELKKAMNCGAVWIKRKGRKRIRLRRAKHEAGIGDVLELFYDGSIIAGTATDPILLESASDYSVWYKPPFLLSQGSNYGDHLSLLRIAEKKLGLKKGPYLVHRLDREASGLMLLAHSRKSAALFSSRFRNRTMTKIYMVRVSGELKEREKSFEITDPLDGKRASSMVTIVSYDQCSNLTELIVKIGTGRYHQIRRHLSMIGHPVCNDRRYAKEKRSQGPLNLCAVELAFFSPSSGKEVRYLLPDYLVEF